MLDTFGTPNSTTNPQAPETTAAPAPSGGVASMSFLSVIARLHHEQDLDAQIAAQGALNPRKNSLQHKYHTHKHTRREGAPIEGEQGF